MINNLIIDNDLVNQAIKISSLKTKKDTITLALQEFIQRRKVKKIIDMFGTVDFDNSYDYKAERNRYL